MSRLYGVNIDNTRWQAIEINSDNYHTYKLIDNENSKIYYLKNIIGVEQVTEDEFLVFDRYNWDQFRISRYKVEKSKLIKIFEKTLSKFHFITDDNILFTYWSSSGGYRSLGIYSIKDNDYVENGKWLDKKLIEVFSYDYSDKIGLYVEDDISSVELINPKLIYAVNPNTLEPISECYSELRDSYIKVSSSDDVKKIKQEDYQYIKIIEDILYQQKYERLQKVKERIKKKNT